MTIRDRYNELRTRFRRRSRSPGPRDKPGTELEDAVMIQGEAGQHSATRQPTIQQSAARRPAGALPLGGGAPQPLKDAGESAQTDILAVNLEGRSPEDCQPAAEDDQTAGVIDVCDQDVVGLDHANDAAQTTVASAHPTTEPQPTLNLSAPLVKSGLAAFKWALQITREVSEASEVLGPLKAATGGVLNVWDRYEASDDVEEDFDRAAKKMHAVNDVLKKYSARSDLRGPTQSLADVLVLVQHHITRKNDRSRLRRMADAPDDAKDAATAMRMLRDVAEVFVINVTASMDSKLDTLLENQQLDRLRYVSAALYQAIPSEGCLDGTCVQLLAELLYWATTEDDVPPVCFLSGPAGFGKTTVAYTMCTILGGLGVLGGSFFCSRDAETDRRLLRSIFSTLARSLALVSHTYCQLLAKTLQKEPGVSDYDPSKQFEILFSNIQDCNTPDHPRTGTEPANFKVFVIDALDECEDSDEATYKMLHILRDKVRGRQRRFLIVSRPEPRIVQAFSMPDSGWSSIVRFQDVPEDVSMSDVSKYLRRELVKCAHDRCLSNWPSDDDFHQLELRASGLFIYAATACKFIATFGGDPRKRLYEVVQLGSSGIDPMYGFVLSTALARQTTEERSITLRFLRAVIFTFEPLSLQALAHLLQIDEDMLRLTVSVLYSVVNVPEPGSGAPVTTFHASFADYLLSSERSSGQPWRFDVESVHLDVFASCVRTMKQGLHFNVSQTRTSYARNEDQPDGPSVTDALRYACIFWMDHLENAAASVADAEQLVTVFPGAFLFWLEVMSVANRTELGLEMMARLLNWLGKRALRYKALVVHDQPTGTRAAVPHRQNMIASGGAQGRVDSKQSYANLLMGTARDAMMFMKMFAEPIRASVAHIYLSVLMHDTTPYKRIIPHHVLYGTLPAVKTNQKRVLSPFLLLGHEDSVSSVAFSHDGTRIASGSDNTIRLWDADTGAAIGSPLRGHEDSVNSVAFSPDGTRIASGSDDNTIRLWDAETGIAIGDPLRGHEDDVYSVAFSPDGTCIASGSCDHTIRLWDAGTGAAIGDPLRGHETRVHSVAFSPDGARIASCSRDHTIRLWDGETGVAIGDPLDDHGHSVWSIAFSPDGTRIASSSRDKTIRLWDAETGAAIGDPVQVDEHLVLSLAFSPDGTRIASGSRDNTIRLWDADTGAAIGEPLRGHEDDVNSVAFSPDGTHIVSGSNDKTIRLWEADPGAAIGNPIQGHEYLVTSIAFSPDGTRIASGSRDCTIRLWDAETGAAIGDPLRGHEDVVYSVAFSPDGTRIASGSRDDTIRLWDANIGAAIGDPIRGHESTVDSVAFSPDGTRIASGSRDETIRVWDAETGAAIGDPLRGHDHSVFSVAFSPDGTCIASGSEDKTIRVWDAETGAAIGDPLRGHEDDVYSVTFSPDGTRIASGSEDKTIRVWNAETGAAIGDPLRGHKARVLSVAFSPDGTCIASGSLDATIRLWDAEIGAAIGGPLSDQEYPILCVAFSPDGTRIASGSSDNIIRLWNAENGATIDNPLRDHEDPDRSDAFLPDGTRIAPGSNGNTTRPRHREPGAATPRYVAFSPNVSHSTQVDALIPNATGPCDAFSLNNKGWLCGPQGELFLWLPREYRRGLWWPRTRAIMGVHPVILDLSRFAHGEAWIDCYSQIFGDDANDAAKIME